MKTVNETIRQAIAKHIAARHWSPLLEYAVDMQEIGMQELDTLRADLQNGPVTMTVRVTVFTHERTPDPLTVASAQETPCEVELSLQSDDAIRASVVGEGQVCKCCTRKVWKAKAEQIAKEHDPSDLRAKLAAMLLTVISERDEIEPLLNRRYKRRKKHHHN